MVSRIWPGALSLIFHGLLVILGVLALEPRVKARASDPRPIEIHVSDAPRAPNARSGLRSARISKAVKPRPPSRSVDAKIEDRLSSEETPDQTRTQAGSDSSDLASLPRAVAARSYLDRVVEELLRARHYPRAAEIRHLEGRVVVEFAITSAGAISRAELVEPCAHSILNEAALDLVRSRREFLPPPAGAESPLIVRVPIEYSLSQVR